jgi:hypothetical protein
VTVPELKEVTEKQFVIIDKLDKKPKVCIKPKSSV